MTRIFVYGTLREGMYNYDIYLKGRVTNIQKAYVKGALYQIQGVVYPALLAGDSFIAGEIMEIETEDILTELDEMEGYIEADHIENEYDRIPMMIYDEAFQPIETLPVYFYNVRNPKRKSQLGNRIPQNDYVAFMKESQK